jgi:hypothetical protein
MKHCGEHSQRISHEQNSLGGIDRDALVGIPND